MRIRIATEVHRRWGNKEQLFKNLKTGDDTHVGYKVAFVEVCINYFRISSPQKYPAIHAHMKW